MADNTGFESLTIERILPAPPETIWRLWTEPQHFALWYGPDGSTITSATMDVRIGGSRLLGMEVTTPQGQMTMWFTGEYLEVVENVRLAYTDSLADEHGNLLSAHQLGLPPGHPTTTEVQVDLEPVAGGTSLVLTHLGIPAGSLGASGWTMALDKLASQLDGDAAR